MEHCVAEVTTHIYFSVCWWVSEFQACVGSLAVSGASAKGSDYAENCNACCFVSLSFLAIFYFVLFRGVFFL